jgi:hypothetical protein
MKNTSLILSFLALTFLCSCGDSSDGANQIHERAEITSQLNGVFLLDNDTLKITTFSDVFGKSIHFDTKATIVGEKKSAFNEASLIDQSTKMEHYRVKKWISGDSIYVAYELLDFTFDFASDSWSVVDTIVITDHSAKVPSIVNLGGTYKRVK